MRSIFVLRGIPGCGKSTFARELLKKEPKRWKRINRDELRLMLDADAFNPDNEDFITVVQDQLMRSALKEGYDVISDNTNLNPHVVKKLHRLAESVGDVTVIEKGFNVPIEECHRRNKLREAKVPDHVIDNMAKKAGLDGKRKLEDREAYYPPLQFRGQYQQDAKLPKAIICDLDGTLALMNGRNPYDASTCDQDLPNVPVIECVRAMHHQGYEIIFMSGREDKYREPTEVFIKQHCQVFNMAGHQFTIPHQLFMRTSGDMRKDSIIKGELFEANIAGKYFVQFVLDDRNQVVNFWRYDLGLPTFQVAEGDF